MNGEFMRREPRLPGVKASAGSVGGKPRGLAPPAGGPNAPGEADGSVVWTLDKTPPLRESKQHA